MAANQGHNLLVLSARLLTRDALRFSPAGVPVLNLKLGHHSLQIEAGSERAVAMELDAVAVGDLARSLQTAKLDGWMRIEGFIARKFRLGPALELHITKCELMEFRDGSL